MKKIKISFVLLIVTLFVTSATMAQNQKAPAKKSPEKAAKPLRYRTCNPAIDGLNGQEVSISDAVTWSQSQPLEVTCDGKVKVELYQFQVQLVYKDPFSTNDFGIGEAGIPILAQNAIKDAKPGDTVLLKNVTFKDPTTREVLKLPNIVFTLK